MPAGVPSCVATWGDDGGTKIPGCVVAPVVLFVAPTVVVPFVAPAVPVVLPMPTSGEVAPAVVPIWVAAWGEDGVTKTPG